MSYERSGYDDLWNWFELSYAAWLTLPRVMMHDMPDEWQAKMAALLEEWDATWVNPPHLRTRVTLVSHGGKLMKMHDWLPYRHPDNETLASFKEPKP